MTVVTRIVNVSIVNNENAIFIDAFSQGCQRRKIITKNRPDRSKDHDIVACQISDLFSDIARFKCAQMIDFEFLGFLPGKRDKFRNGIYPITSASQFLRQLHRNGPLAAPQIKDFQAGTFFEMIADQADDRIGSAPISQRSCRMYGKNG